MDGQSKRVRDGQRRRSQPGVEGLEGRQLLSSTPSQFSLVSATTVDSKSVTVTYDIQGANLTGTVPLGVYRSTDPQFGADDVSVSTVQLVAPGSTNPATLDSNGQVATTAGDHTVTFALPNGLPPNPMHPYVLVVADPTHTTDLVDHTHDTASFRKYVIGVVTHGGMQPKSQAGGPFWQRRMVKELQSQGYDSALLFNWVYASHQPGAVVRQAPHLAEQLTAAVEQFPAGSIVDVHLIGHSEGAIINNLALQEMASTEPAAMRAGYVLDTMLDPHAASNGIQGQQYSVSHGIMGQVARQVIDKYQSEAKDPPPFVPSNATATEVFFQRTPVSKAEGGNQGAYNLWGQVPVIGDATYFDLTAPGISHSGHFAVYDWYQVNVVPTLGNGAPFLGADRLTAELVTPSATDLSNRGNHHVQEKRLTYTGTAAPGTVVKLTAARPKSTVLGPIAWTTAGADGTWTVTTRPLYPGMYRVVVRSGAPVGPHNRKLFIRPTAWPGTVTIDPQNKRSAFLDRASSR